MRFLANMGISTRTVIWLREQGHAAIHLREEGLNRAADEAILVNARLENVLAQCADDLEAGAIISVNEESIRVRRLPI
jgi:predicted nuclease of predicted toxin-antitoxin system